jgi:hypothetical protein
MKWLFLALGGCIFFNSLSAYRELGQQFGGMGSAAAVITFLIVQGMELRPIVMTGGVMNIWNEVKKVMAGRPGNNPQVDPDELAEANGWAFAGYGIDLIAGLLVWPIVNRWELLKIGAVTMADINFWNVAQIIACVFLLQKCFQQYLKRGGKVPGFLGGKRVNG